MDYNSVNKKGKKKISLYVNEHKVIGSQMLTLWGTISSHLKQQTSVSGLCTT